MNVSLFFSLYKTCPMCYTPYVRSKLKIKAVCSLGGTSSVCPHIIAPMPGVRSPSKKKQNKRFVGSLVLAVAPGVGRVVKDFKALCLGQESVISGGTAEPSRSQP